MVRFSGMRLHALVIAAIRAGRSRRGRDCRSHAPIGARHARWPGVAAAMNLRPTPAVSRAWPAPTKKAGSTRQPDACRDRHVRWSAPCARCRTLPQQRVLDSRPLPRSGTLRATSRRAVLAATADHQTTRIKPEPKQRADGCPSALVMNGAPGRIRTSDPQVRSLVLYPTELRARRSEIMKREPPVRQSIQHRRRHLNHAETPWRNAASAPYRPRHHELGTMAVGMAKSEA